MLEFTVSLFIVSLFLGAVFYLVLCVDPNNQGPLGMLHRLIYKYLPDFFNKILGGEDSRVSRALSGICNYLCYSNHPLVQFFYILVAPGGFALYWWVGLSVHFDDNPQVSWVHKYFAALLSYFAFFTYYMACSTSPGEVNSKNVKSYIKKYDHYYDGILYTKKNQCKTCEFDKPARSKHCSTCKMCVAKFDHHCIWIRQCVGEKNYKHFLTFLLTHAILTLYGVYIGLYAFYGIILQSQLLEAKFRGPTGEIVDATWGIVFRYMFFKETLFVFMVILCGIMGITLLLFYSYHLTLVKAQVTTNEKIKRSDCMSFIKKKTKLVMEQVKLEQDKEKKQELLTKIETLTKDFAKLEKWQGNKSLWACLKEVYAQ